MGRNLSKSRRIISITLLGLLLNVAYGSYKICSSRAYLWLPDALSNSPGIAPQDKPIDVIYVVIDHWEPGGNQEALRAWMHNYPELSNKHIDGDGVRLRHSWFYPIEQFRGYEVDSLVTLCRRGYGDIEIHLHHNDDDSASLDRKLRAGIDSLHAHGALISPDGKVHFAFVHGNWALDNSRTVGGHNYCGVNDEISILLRSGCYADFTFPALFQSAQPSLTNKIYYCRDDPTRPKSHNTGPLSSVGIVGRPDQLMIFEGPLVIDWKNWQFITHPNLEDGNMYAEIETSLHRFNVWLAANIHVRGRPNWVFVRPFSHGCTLDPQDAFDNILGTRVDRMLTDVERAYNDGKRYRLHYMTAREAYNVAKAAEAGLDGNPNDYRNYLVQPYEYPATLRRVGADP